ncbi:MAG: MFS transporter [Anaerolineae bacterium]|nr:MFS transporter [Anaerolineae bacterium]
MRFFILALLAIEFLDELVFGVREAAWPLIRDDLGLSYTQIGILLGTPGIFSGIVEPFIGVLGDVWRRRVLVLGGGMFFAVALFLTGTSQSFAVLLLSFMLFYPSSGAFVSLSQSTLMDMEPARHERNMARWNLAGSMGVVCGSLALGATAALNLDWRVLFFALSGLTLIPLVAASRVAFGSGRNHEHNPGLWGGFKEALAALRRREVLRWLTLLTFSDLMGDVLLGYLALYFVDVVATTPAQASAAVAIWTVVSLLMDSLTIPLLERIRGAYLLRAGALMELVLLPIFLLVPGFGPKLVLLALLGVFNAGWYPVLQARLYSEMPGQSGRVMTVGNLFGLVGGLLPLGLGLVAERFDLAAMMWLLLLGPIALLVGIPRRFRT